MSTVFWDFIPEEPDNIVILYEYVGFEVPYFDTDVSHRSIQISVRNNNASLAKEEAWKIFNKLKADNKRIDFTDTVWGHLTLRQPPFKMREDKNERVFYGFNIGLTTNIE